MRWVEDITEVLWGIEISPSTISELHNKAYVHIEDWQNHSSQGGRYPQSLLMGAICVATRGNRLKNEVVQVAIVVNEDGQHEILNVAQDMKGDKTSWLSFILWIRSRDLNRGQLVV